LGAEGSADCRAGVPLPLPSPPSNNSPPSDIPREREEEAEEREGGTTTDDDKRANSRRREQWDGGFARLFVLDAVSQIRRRVAHEH
jgi:hypothetical protein